MFIKTVAPDVLFLTSKSFVLFKCAAWLWRCACFNGSYAAWGNRFCWHLMFDLCARKSGQGPRATRSEASSKLDKMARAVTLTSLGSVLKAPMAWRVIVQPDVVIW